MHVSFPTGTPCSDPNGATALGEPTSAAARPRQRRATERSPAEVEGQVRTLMM